MLQVSRKLDPQRQLVSAGFWHTRRDILVRDKRLVTQLTWGAELLKTFVILFSHLYRLGLQKHIAPTKADMIMTSLERCDFKVKKKKPSCNPAVV